MRKLLNNKKGAEMAIGTLVVIVLAIIVLVVIALGFGMGWSNLWSKMTGFFSPANVDSTKQACSYACTTNAQYDFCQLKREVTFLDVNNKKDKLSSTCEILSGTNSPKPDWGFEACSEFSCSSAPKCTGTAKACSAITAQGLCNTQTGCGWGTACTGTVTPCTDMTETKCKTQEGCTWS